MKKRNAYRFSVVVVGTLLLAPALLGQAPDAAPAQAKPAQTAPAATATAGGGTIHGTVKAGNVPLPGVSITATNTLTAKKYATTTDIDGNYAMTIPKTGRYVLKAELAAFATVTNEVRLTADAADQASAFSLQLASRVTQAEAGQTAAVAALAQRGVQALNMTGDASATDASAGGAVAGASLPSLGGLGGDSGLGATDSVAVSGNIGTTNPLADLNEDQIRQRVEDAMQQARQNGGGAGDQMGAVVSMLSGILGGPGGGGPGGGRGGAGGGRGGPGGGGGGFRNFNPAQPHGTVFYTFGDNALNSAPWQPSLVPEVNPAGYRNQFGASIAGSPYIPGLTKPDTRQFVFVNVNGQRNLNAFSPTPVRVPTLLERMGNFSQSSQLVNGVLTPVTIYNPATGLPFTNNMIPTCTAGATQGCITQQALNLLNYYPAPNINVNDLDPRDYNYQTISNAGANNFSINSRYQRQLGAQTGTGGRRGGFGGGGGGGRGGGGGGQRGNQNAPPVLRQNINASFNYSHTASDNRNIFLPLGGATQNNGYGLNAGYVISYGRLSNNASVSWNRSNGENRNYFTDTANNPSAAVGLAVPNPAANFADPRFYNGLPSLGFTGFAGLNNQTPSETVNQTISFSDVVAWRHKKHNYRFGGDIRRLHADAIGGNNPLGSYSFTGYATSKPTDQTAGLGGTASGSGFADFLVGQPTTTSIQAGSFKDYLRENIYDLYAVDDYRVKSNVTINYSLRYDYYGPYSEKNNHLVNLDHNADFSAVSTVLPNATGAYEGAYPGGLINPDRTLFSPRVGLAYSPKLGAWTKNLVVRGGYGVNYNTGQYAVFAQKLSRQVPFSVTQNNTILTSSGCTLKTLTLVNGFGCSTGLAINNNWAVDKNYRLGMVQIFNLNIQKTIGPAIVVNLGYNGSKGSNLDTVGTPNGTPTGVTTPGVSAFDYEESAAGAHTNSLVVSVTQRQRKGVALGATYTYSHSIDNASGVGGAVGTPVQDFYRLDLEEGNSSFDQRHNLTGNWLLELPFGPNREFLNKGGLASKLLDGYSLSGSFTFATGTYFTPNYANNQAEAAAANTFNQRPNRVATVPIVGAGKVHSFFNTAAFAAPAIGQYGTASQGSIEGPGTTSVNAALSRTVQLGGTNSIEVRIQASNVFNTVQYNRINVTENSNQFGQVTGAADMRAILLVARYRF